MSILAVLNSDMLGKVLNIHHLIFVTTNYSHLPFLWLLHVVGYTLPNQTSIIVGMKDRYSTGWLLEFVNSLTQAYVPSLGVGSSPSCCSDHQSFFEQGYPAVGYFENPYTASDYPHYHKSTDLPQYINWRQLHLIVQAIAAAAATLALPLD